MNCMHRVYESHGCKLVNINLVLTLKLHDTTSALILEVTFFYPASCCGTQLWPISHEVMLLKTNKQVKSHPLSHGIYSKSYVIKHVLL